MHIAEALLEMADELRGDLVFVAQDMGADVGAHVPHGCARLVREHPGGLARDAGVRALPPGMDDREAAGRHEHDGHAVGEAEHDGHVGRGADDAVRAPGNFGAHTLELRGARAADDRDMVAVHLVGHEEVWGGAPRTEGGEHPAAVLGDGRGVVAHMAAQVERRERGLGHAARALGEPEGHRPCTPAHHRHAAALPTLEPVHAASSPPKPRPHDSARAGTGAHPCMVPRSAREARPMPEMG